MMKSLEEFKLFLFLPNWTAIVKGIEFTEFVPWQGEICCLRIFIVTYDELPFGKQVAVINHTHTGI